MLCPEGCISEDVCSDDSTFIIMSIFLAFIGFCGGQMCYIVSLRRKLDEFEHPSNDEESNLIREVPPPYQRTDNM